MTVSDKTECGVSNASSKDIRQVAMELYASPFRFDRCGGYIYDAKNNMIADDDDRKIALRVRGWGRISYRDAPEKLQDTVGELLAEALTRFWVEQDAPSIAVRLVQLSKDNDLLIAERDIYKDRCLAMEVELNKAKADLVESRVGR